VDEKQGNGVLSYQILIMVLIAILVLGSVNTKIEYDKMDERNTGKSIALDWSRDQICKMNLPDSDEWGEAYGDVVCSDWNSCTIQCYKRDYNTEEKHLGWQEFEVPIID